MRLFSKVCFVAVLVFATAISWAGTTVSPFLENYDQLRPGKYVEKYYFDNQALLEKGYISIAVKDVDVSRIKDSWGLKPEEAAAFLKRELQVAANRAHIGHFFDFEANNGTQGSLELAIIEQNSGAPVGRLFSAFGWGQAYFRVEGRIRDTQTNRVIAAFSHFRASKASWPFRDLGQNGGVTMIKEMLAGASAEIINEIGDSFGYIPAFRREDLPFKYA